MLKVKHFTLGVAGAALLAAALAFAPAALAAPSGYFDFTHSYTEDTGIVCGSGANSFDIIDSATVHKYGPSFSDEHGNFVKDILFIETVGTFSNSVQVARHRARQRRDPGGLQQHLHRRDDRGDEHHRSRPRGRLAGRRSGRRHVRSERRRDARVEWAAR